MKIRMKGAQVMTGNTILEPYRIYDLPIDKAEEMIRKGYAQIVIPRKGRNADKPIQRPNPNSTENSY